MAEKAGVHARAQESKQKCSNFCNQKPNPSFSGSTADTILQLQRTAGNQAVQKLIKSRALQAKLKISQPNDIYEQEADRVANEVMRMPLKTGDSDQSSVDSTSTKPVNQLKPGCLFAKGPPCGEEELLERTTMPQMMHYPDPDSGQGPDVPPSAESAIRSLTGRGQYLSRSERSFFEPHFGHDFGGVRIHSGHDAGELADALCAKAFTVGKDVVFGEGEHIMGTSKGRRLLAHELTHVVQQSRSQLPITTATRPGLVQRQKGDAKQAARARVDAAMKKLKAKFGLAKVTEENGATWSESELAKVDAAFSKVSKEDQPLLKDLHLVRTDKFEPFVRQGKTFKIAGTTFGIGMIKLAREAFQGDASTILHEVGHLIQNKVASAMLEKSKAKFDLEATRLILAEGQKKAPTRVGHEIQAFVAALSLVSAAAIDLMNSGEDDRTAKQSVLDDAKMQADIARLEVERLTNDDAAKTWLEVHDRQQKWVEAIEKYAEEKGKKNLTGFIDVVTKNNLARKRYAPFTDYVAAHWPTKPEEFFAQSFHTWRTNPNYMKRNMKPLFDWFEKGGHRESKGYLEGKGAIETVREAAPVIYELGKEFKETFWPKEFQDAIFGNQ